MKLIMTLLVRDEVDIVRYNIEHHLACGVDYVIAVDNGSVDGTRDILSDYERLGVATVIDEPGRDYSQAKWVTRAAIMARDEFGADWILNNDADEFWLSPDGQLKNQLESTGAQMIQCERRNMFYPYDDDAKTSWFNKLIYRVNSPTQLTNLSNIYTDELPCPYLYLELPPKVMVRGRGLKFVTQGNHSAVYNKDVETIVSDIIIYHFPVRSSAQFKQKILQGGEAYFKNRELSEMTGWHWRRWYRKFLESGVASTLAEVLPSADRLKQDLAEGRVVEDRTIQYLFREC